MSEAPKALPKFEHPPIDTHFHPWTKTEWKSARSLRLVLDSYLYHRQFTEQDLTDKSPNEDQMAALYRRLGVVGMPVGWNTKTYTGDTPTTNDYIANLCKTYPDVFIAGWACVDPLDLKTAMKEAERAITKLNLIGFKFQQASQGFKINDPKYAPLWKLINDLKVPVQLHGGYTGVGTGVPGSQGIKIYLNRPYPDMEDIAVDYPNIKLFVLHVGDPWVGEFAALARHGGNVYRECSGMWPRYWPSEMWYELNRRLTDKYVWGTDYPLFDLEQLLMEHLTCKDPKGEKGYREGIVEKVLWKNAIEILKDDFKRVGVDLSRWGVQG